MIGDFNGLYNPDSYFSDTIKNLRKQALKNNTYQIGAFQKIILDWETSSGQSKCISFFIERRKKSFLSINIIHLNYTKMQV